MWQSVRCNSDELRHACLHNDVETLRKLCKSKNVNIEIEDSDCTTPLMLACYYGNYDVVYELISNQNALIDHGNNMDVTPLHYACEQQHIDIVKLLLDNNANLNTQTKKGYTPLHYAASTNNFELCKLLLLAGANKTTKDNYGQSAINIVNKKKYAEIIFLFQSKNISEIKNLQIHNHPHKHTTGTSTLKSIKNSTHSIELEKERIMRGEISTLKDKLNEISYENDQRVDKLMQRITSVEDYVQTLSVSVQTMLETPKFRNMRIPVPQKQHIIITDIDTSMDMDMDMQLAHSDEEETPMTELNTPISDHENVIIDLHTDLDYGYSMEDEECKNDRLCRLPSLKPEACSLELGGFSDYEGTTVTGTVTGHSTKTTTPRLQSLVNIVQDEEIGIDIDVVNMSPIVEHDIDDDDTPVPAVYAPVLQNKYNSSPVAPTPNPSPHKRMKGGGVGGGVSKVETFEYNRQRAKTESKYTTSTNFDGIAPHINDDDDIHNYPDLDDEQSTHQEIVISEEEYLKLMGINYKPQTVRHHSGPLLSSVSSSRLHVNTINTINTTNDKINLREISIPNTIGMLGTISPNTVDAVTRSTKHHEEMSNVARQFESGTFYTGKHVRKISVKLKKKSRCTRTQSVGARHDKMNNRTYNSSKKLKKRQFSNIKTPFNNRQSMTPQPFNKQNVNINKSHLQSVTPQPSSSTYVSASFNMNNGQNNNKRNTQKLYNDVGNQSLRNRKNNKNKDSFRRKKMTKRKKKTFSPNSIVYVDD